jgi:hypothetical protein
MLAAQLARAAGRTEAACPGRGSDPMAHDRTSPTEAAAYLPSRWRGQADRLEVWYTTITDPATGTGVWLHHELVAPSDGASAHAHGWAAVFPPGQEPVHARFGPAPHRQLDGTAVFAADDVTMSIDRLNGDAGDFRWDLAASGGGEPLCTFPRWAWSRELLPAAQVVPYPSATFRGVVRHPGGELVLDGAPGATARIYGRGNAQRWTWLHADLGGGDVLEIVAAVSRRPVLRALPPLVFLRLRLEGTEWPAADPLLVAPLFRVRMGLPMWTVTGAVGGRRIRVAVTQPPERTLSLDYRDPDDAPAVCHNSERADAEITLQRRTGRIWSAERHWRLEGTAHAEVGTRE